MSKRAEMLRQQNRLAMKNEMEEGFRKMHSVGMARGAYAMAQVILQKANNTELTLEERLTDIVQFCEKCRNIDENKAEPEAGQADDAE